MSHICPLGKSCLQVITQQPQNSPLLLLCILCGLHVAVLDAQGGEHPWPLAGGTMSLPAKLTPVPPALLPLEYFPEAPQGSRSRRWRCSWTHRIHCHLQMLEARQPEIDREIQGCCCLGQSGSGVVRGACWSELCCTEWPWGPRSSPVSRVRARGLSGRGDCIEKGGGALSAV